MFGHDVVPVDLCALFMVFVIIWENIHVSDQLVERNPISKEFNFDKKVG